MALNNELNKELAKQDIQAQMELVQLECELDEALICANADCTDG